MTSWNCRAVFALALLAAAAPVRAQQDFPNRPMTMVVPFTPGGGIDTIGRVVGAKLPEMWGQQVVVEGAFALKNELLLEPDEE